MNQAASYASTSQAVSAASAGGLLSELVAAMPIVMLFKAVRAAMTR